MANPIMSEIFAQRNGGSLARPHARTIQVTVTVSRFRSLPVSAWHGIRPTLELRRVEPRKKLFLCMQEAQLPARAPRPQGCADNATTPSSIFCCGPVTSITHNLSGRGRGGVSHGNVRRQRGNSADQAKCTHVDRGAITLTHVLLMKCSIGQ